MQNETVLISRRAMLRNACVGMGNLALAALLAEEGGASTNAGASALDAPHFVPRAKRIIFLFMHGGPSQVDTFDYKPRLASEDGQPYPYEKPRVQFEENRGLLRSPWRFNQHGETGAWVSELFPHLATTVDRICFLKGMYGSNPAHGGALLMLHTGSDRFVRPSMGSWITYGLGSENQNLPGFVTISPSSAHGGIANYASAFLPTQYHGTPLGPERGSLRGATIDNLQNERLAPETVTRRLAMLERLNRSQLESTGPDALLEGRIASMELAFRMQIEAPEALDLERESQATKQLYGLNDEATERFGRQCLMARRLSERGVRIVQCTDRGWDQHDNLRRDLANNAREVDKPIAGLIKDLAARGLLDDTLVIWGGEFGRTPSGEHGRRDGRDHNPAGFTMFLAGGGVRPGAYGATDDYGYFAVRQKVHIHDLHATILHLLGLSHTKLTYRFQGRDFRLTDVHGHVIDDILL